MGRFITSIVSVLAIAGIAAGNARVTHASVPGDTLYGTHPNRIVTVDQNDGSIAWVTIQRGFTFYGLAFDSAGRLFAAGCIDPCFYWISGLLLMELDPLTGEVVDIIGPVTDVSGSNVAIRALSVQPETDVLFGFSDEFHSPPHPRIWTIDKSTATATLVASEVPAGCGYCDYGSAFGFAPDGTLYHIYKDLPEIALMTVDPSTGAELTSVPLSVPSERLYSFHSLAVRSDGTIFSISRGYGPRRHCPTCTPPPFIPPVIVNN